MFSTSHRHILYLFRSLRPKQFVFLAVVLILLACVIIILNVVIRLHTFRCLLFSSSSSFFTWDFSCMLVVVHCLDLQELFKKNQKKKTSHIYAVNFTWIEFFYWIIDEKPKRIIHRYLITPNETRKKTYAQPSSTFLNLLLISSAGFVLAWHVLPVADEVQAGEQRNWSNGK